MNRKSHTGFSLIEVLVAVLVLSIGLLGLAALQMTGMRQSNSAYMRSQATLMAYDIADRIRTNRKGYEDGNYNSIAIEDSYSEMDCSSGCSSADLAAFDAWEWKANIDDKLPGGEGGVEGGGNPNLLTVSIRWHDDRSGTKETFTMEFLP